MRAKTVILIVIAGMFGVLAVVFANSWLADQRSAMAPMANAPVTAAPTETEANDGGYDSPPAGLGNGGSGSGGGSGGVGLAAGGSSGSGGGGWDSGQEPYPMDVAPETSEAEEAAAYEAYKREQAQREAYEQQLRAQAEALRAEMERAAETGKASAPDQPSTSAGPPPAGNTEIDPGDGLPPLPPDPAPASAQDQPSTGPVLFPAAGAEVDPDDGNLPPPPPAPEPATEQVVRHPTIDAPDEVVAGDVVTVSIALTEEQLTPEVKVKAAPGTTVTEDGALRMAMPAGTEQWPIDIDLFASGFDLADGGKWSRATTLYREGDSDFVRFELKARPIGQDSKPGQFIARIYSAGRFLGSASRPVTIARTRIPAPGAEAATPAPAMLLASAPRQPLTGSIDLNGDGDVPDLDVTILYDDPSGLGSGQIIIHSPHLAGPVTDSFSTPPEMAAWLESEYQRLLQLGLSLRGAVSLQQPAASNDPEAQKRFVTLAAEGFGDVLYRDYVPKVFKHVFWSLRGKGELRSIQITSNSPTLPWELIRPRSEDGATQDGFLGMGYRLARWAPRSMSSQVDNPLDRLVFTGVAAVAPSYADKQSLSFQQVEIEALSKLSGYRRFDGDFVSFERLVGEVSTGFIHFSGHGEVNQPGSGRPVFAIDLVDQSLDPDTWRALVAAHGTGNPFYFFNACDSGRSQMFGGFVQGWGPAVLASGASGFIGGMWPLTDRAAAAFSADFYGGITTRLKDGPVYLAEILQGVRKRFYETGDPTYLAYTFYGNANLQVVTQ
ncbi:MAG: CHAT domain-containing protein [Mesorhizobium sp.]|uniref:CHAT domain-containing protein n=2 Tax=Mesorhizobium sp. TaxID=1871066 RepID=UPI000FE74029|nr:CHAT domain-containing protein [Mesorhizobium sp.]RWF40844.1 MAG: CHAT domain-containing protein [Mesorhizobium sp.]TJW08739.1 MAG: CHAT domain-containing protein [Mesorhizobium sp.]